ncbi:hypothetical protein RI129_001150 [Pyrocoelia pectoralis]|uniref:DDE Tnp4 domain-containing protein n=1 Tax=Pyrocoelia pectoralis TaxID=417401 RepID=A0AAN7ZWX9_9COLE
MSSEDEYFLLAAAYSVLIKKKSNKLLQRPRNRTKWVKECLLKRSKYTHVNLLQELRFEPDDWRNYLRMDEDSYVRLLTLVSPLTERKDTMLRAAITPHERLTATLRYLATGRNYEDLKFSTLISPQSLGKIIPETCRAVVEVLKTEYMKFPATEDEWIRIANDFEKKCNFVNCVGACDGKHVNIIPPAGSGSYYYNYKGTHSLVLMAVVSANCEFIMCDFGINGRISDGGVLEYTNVYKKLKNGQLSLPAPIKPKNSEIVLPFVFIGDEAFTLRKKFVKPFSRKALNNEKKIFNYRLSRARSKVENAFGILSNRFRIFHTAISVNLEAIDNIVMATCVLHNYLRRRSGNLYAPNNNLYREDALTGTIELGLQPTDFISLQQTHNQRVDNVAKHVRELYLHYFNNEGAVEWQQRMVH